MKDLYQSGPANWLLSSSIDPQLEYLESDSFDVQQQDPKHQVSDANSCYIVDTVRTGAFWRGLQQPR